MILDELPSREELAQFLTPELIAEFMAAMFTFSESPLSLLDAGAGAGSLTRAVVKRACNATARPVSVAITAVEVDAGIRAALEKTLQECRARCAATGISFEANLIADDFLAFASDLLRTDLFVSAKAPFNAAVLNPPYRKIRSDSEERKHLRASGMETSNLYTGFLYLAAKLLSTGGEMVAIVPRSFCNGPYFRAFRDAFFSMMSLRRIHIFDSRKEAFKGDAVLQENIIIHAVKSKESVREICISTSRGMPGEDDRIEWHPLAAIIDPADPERFVHIPTESSDADARTALKNLKTSLPLLGLEVSTGRVVDFRARSLLRARPEAAPELNHPYCL